MPRCRAVTQGAAAAAAAAAAALCAMPVRYDARCADAEGVAHVVLPDGRRVEYFRYGDPGGSPVVLVHGSVRDGSVFAGYDAALREQGVRALAPSLPGCGCSSPVRLRQLRDWPADVLAVLEREGVGDFGVVGVSFGGPHALALAAAAPPRVTGVAVMSATAPRDAALAARLPPARPALALRAVSTPVLGELVAAAALSATDLVAKLSGKGAQRVFDRLRADGRGAVADAIAASGRRAFRWTGRGLAENARVRESAWGLDLTSWRAAGPVVFFGTEDDDVDPLTTQRLLASLVQGARLEILPSGLGHWYYFAHLDAAVAVAAGRG